MANHDARDAGGAWSAATEGWLRFWTRLTTSFIETQRATAASFGLPATESTRDTVAASVPSMAYRRGDWAFERSVDSVEDFAVGDVVTFTKQLTDEDVRAFARASGDTNRLHLDEAFAGETRFGGRIVHGTLVVGLVSAALARLPGVTIYLSQDVRYLRPVEIGQTVTATCELVEDLGEGKFRFITVVTDDEGETIVDGEAVVLIDALPDDAN